MTENNNNMIFSVSVTLGVIGVLMVISSIGKMGTPKEQKFVSANLVVSSPLDLSRITNVDSSDKKIPTVTLPGLVEENVKAVKSVKNIKALNLDINRTINISGPISDNALFAANAIRVLNAKSKDPIYLVLYSPGGSVITGAALISAMQVSEAPVYTVCYTFCASMASMIHQYGVKRYVTDRTILMFHPASFGTEGQVDNMFSQISMIRRYINKIEMEVAARMKLTFQQYKNLTANEYWIDSEDGLKANATDVIVYIVPSNASNILIEPIVEEPEEKTTIKKRDIRNLEWIYNQ